MNGRVSSACRLLILLALFASPAAAQQAAGDRAWNAGEHDAARRAYEQVLASDSTAFFANLRIGVLLSWQGKLDSSLVFLERARRTNPDDLEARVIHARVLSWARRFDDAVAQYDSLLAIAPDNRDALLGRARVLSWSGQQDAAAETYDRLLARDPDDREALIGRAQVAAWSGRLDDAERRYRDALARDPRSLDALVGLGYVYQWRGEPGRALRQADAALAIDSTYQTALDLRRVARGATRPDGEVLAAWSNDSDENTNFWQTVSGSAYVGASTRAFGNVGLLQARGPGLEALRYSAEAGLGYAVGPVRLLAAAGARRLAPDASESRTEPTFRSRLTTRLTAGTSAGIGFTHVPFDEIASLIARDLDIDALDGGIDTRLARNLNLSVAGGAAWFSDGNTRGAASLTVVQTVYHGLFVGTFGRWLSFDERGVGYFSPDRFLVGEAIAGYNLSGDRWSGRVSGGLGVQQVGEDGVSQSEWHLEGRLGRSWGTGNRIEAFALVTNSAASSTSGAYGYRSAGVTVRLGL